MYMCGNHNLGYSGLQNSCHTHTVRVDFEFSWVADDTKIIHVEGDLRNFLNKAELP